MLFKDIFKVEKEWDGIVSILEKKLLPSFFDFAEERIGKAMPEDLPAELTDAFRKIFDEYLPRYELCYITSRPRFSFHFRRGDKLFKMKVHETKIDGTVETI